MHVTEEKTLSKTVRENKLSDEVKKVMQRIQKEGSDPVKETDDCHRIRKYNGNRVKQMRC